MAQTRKTVEDLGQSPPAVSRRPRSRVHRISMEDAVRSFGVLLAAREGLTHPDTGDDLASDQDVERALDSLAAFLMEMDSV